MPLALVLLAALGLSVYRVTSSGSAQTYRAHGVSFDYPAGWQEESIPASISGGAQLLWTDRWVSLVMEINLQPGRRLDAIVNPAGLKDIQLREQLLDPRPAT